MTTKTANAMNEEQMVHLVRNALLVAGQEMGQGDQWPVVKDTIYKIMKDWEDLKVERAVDEELKIHLYEQLDKMDAALAECTAEARAVAAPKIKQLREICDAYFSAPDQNSVMCDEETVPPHIKRMEAILNTMEDNHE